LSFSVPSDLKDIVIYWWKILDRPIINIDALHNFIAFDLYLFSLEKTKLIVQQAIKLKYLKYNADKEEIQLGSEMLDLFEIWQAKGSEKLMKMQKVLSEKWRDKLDISDTRKYNVYINDLIDYSIQKKANKIRPSTIQISTKDFKTSIKGTISEINDEEDEITYNFDVLPKKRKISHNCPDYLELRKNRKQFCVHLAALFKKLSVYPDTKVQTKNLVEDIVNNKDKWIFN
jgi:hypothetical protein